MNSIFTLIEKTDPLQSSQTRRSDEPKGFNCLMPASKCSNDKANGSGTDADGLTASDYAWENQSWECLLELLKAEAPFPKCFNRNILVGNTSSESHEIIRHKNEIIDIAQKADEFHKCIKLGYFDEVKSFVAENLKIGFAYNQKNR